MEITKEIIERGTITMRSTDCESYRMVKEYNEHVVDCRYQLKKINQMKFEFIILNPIIMMALCVSCQETIFKNMILAVLLLAINLVMIVVGCFKNYHIYRTLASVLLVFLDLRFIILVIANIILSAVIERMEKPLRSEMGYPNFQRIYIDYDDTMESDTDAVQI